jgi:hypothetical protein
MNIGSLLQLTRSLDRQLSWRKKELTALKFWVENGEENVRNTIIRASLCLLYAHWEGFIKEAATGYVCFVALRGLKFREVAPNLVALGWRADIQKAGRSNLATLHTELTQKMMGGQEEMFRPNWDAAIDVESNLNSKALQQVLCVVGINREEYMTKGPIIDERLVKNRNGIAHGQGVTIDEDDYDDLHDFVVQMLNLFRNDIENSAVLETYKRD